MDSKTQLGDIDIKKKKVCKTANILLRDPSQIMSVAEGGEGLQNADNHWQGGEGGQANVDKADKKKSRKVEK